jgi:hypothetical protein
VERLETTQIVGVRSFQVFEASGNGLLSFAPSPSNPKQIRRGWPRRCRKLPVEGLGAAFGSDMAAFPSSIDGPYENGTYHDTCRGTLHSDPHLPASLEPSAVSECGEPGLLGAKNSPTKTIMVFGRYSDHSRAGKPVLKAWSTCRPRPDHAGVRPPRRSTAPPPAYGDMRLSRRASKCPQLHQWQKWGVLTKSGRWTEQQRPRLKSTEKVIAGGRMDLLDI